jgi:hypothetical protein
MPRPVRCEEEAALPVGGPSHPGPKQLERFLRGELPQPEVPPIVRHLLTGCPACLQVTRRLWRLGDLPFRREEREFMTEAEAAAQEQLREIAADLKTIRFRLEELKGSLPVPTQEEAMLLGEMDMDVSTEMRSVIECVLNDNIDPAIRGLLAAADYVPGEDES